MRQSVVAPALLLAFVFFATAAREQEARVQPSSGVVDNGSNSPSR